MTTTRSSQFSTSTSDAARDTATTADHPSSIMLRSALGASPSSSHAALSDENVDDGNHHQSREGSGAQSPASQVGKLEGLKQREAELASLLAEVRREKLETLRSRPLCIGIVGFGRFGQFIAKTFAKYGRVVVTSRSDYSDVAARLGVTYVPLDAPDAFLQEGLDVIVFAVSILSFKSTVRSFLPSLRTYISQESSHRAPLIVDVLSVKEHARSVLLDLLPPDCDILCTHPMFGPDSGKNGWHNLNFVYEKTRIDRVVLDPAFGTVDGGPNDRDSFADSAGTIHSVHEDSEAHVEGMDRMERFLSIWEEEGCHMVPMSCRDHDAYAANSQFITHLVGRVLGTQGLAATPIDTSGFQSVLKLVDSTTADSFDLFYGLYKYNQNSLDTIRQLQSAMDDVVDRLQERERQENIRQAAKAFHDEAARNRES
jgi:arogenate dehydrogenase (NADP+), plant